MERHLFARFPWLAEKRGQWGLECGDGWERLLTDFLVSVEKHTSGGSGFTVLQVKQKLATLHLYYRLDEAVSQPSRTAIRDASILAEGRSAYTCEQCGARGRRRDAEGFLFVACDEHAQVKGRIVRTPPEMKFLVSGLRKGPAFSRYDPDRDEFVDDESRFTPDDDIQVVGREASVTEERRTGEGNDDG